MNTRDHKMYRFKIDYDYKERVHSGIDKSTFVPAHHCSIHNVIAPAQKLAETIVENRFDGHTNLKVQFIESLPIHDCLVRSTYL